MFARHGSEPDSRPLPVDFSPPSRPADLGSRGADVDVDDPPVRGVGGQEALGLALVAGEGGPIEEIHPGYRVHFEPGENHWHGAAPNRFMTRIAIQEADENGSPVTWGEHVTDDQYNAAPAA